MHLLRKRPADRDLPCPSSSGLNKFIIDNGAVMNKIRCVVVDDHILLRQGVRRLLEGEPDFDVIDEAGDASEALNKVRELRPDIVLMDVGMFCLKSSKETPCACAAFSRSSMTLTKNLRGKVAPGLQFVVGHKRRDFFFAHTRRRTDFGRNTAFFDALYQRFGDGVGILTDIVLQMSAFLTYVIGPDFSAVLQMDNVGGRYRCASRNREEENDTARTHNSRF